MFKIKPNNFSKQVAIKVLIFFSVELILNILFPISIFFIAPSIFYYFLFAAIITFLVYKNVKAAWYILVVYIALNFLYGVYIVTRIYLSLIKNSDVNWGGFISFLFPLIPLIFYLVAIKIILSKRNREYYKNLSVTTPSTEDTEDTSEFDRFKYAVSYNRSALVFTTFVGIILNIDTNTSTMGFWDRVIIILSPIVLLAHFIIALTLDRRKNRNNYLKNHFTCGAAFILITILLAILKCVTR